MYFPPVFFDVMVHLCVDIVDDIIDLGPSYLHNMMPFKRMNGVIKGFISNMYRPYGSIVQGYLTQDCISFYENYLCNRDDDCKARYAVMFQIRTFPPEPEYEAHIGPTATYDKAICPGISNMISQHYRYKDTTSHTIGIQLPQIKYNSGRYMSEYRLQSNAYWQREKHRSP